MSNGGLPPVDLQTYTRRIYEVFFKSYENAENSEVWTDQDELIFQKWSDEIDYDALNSIPQEIDRRRALLKYFVPDVFEGGRYDRRMDVIDGAIYYIEYLGRTGNENIVRELWAERAGLSSSWKELFSVLEDTEGIYLRYHPIWTVIGNLLYPERMIPKLIRHVQVFKGKKRRLDPNDFGLIFTGIYFSQHPTIQLTPKIIHFLNILFAELQKIPMEDKIIWKDLMQQHGIKNPRGLQTDINRINLAILNIYNRGVLGLDMYRYFCPFPTHVRLEHKEGIATEYFLINGDSNFQELSFLIPRGGDWQALLNKFQRLSPDTHCWRTTRLKTKIISPIKYFNLDTQRWELPWDLLTRRWREWIETQEFSDELLTPPTYRIKPNHEFNKVMWLLETDANLSNHELRRRAKITSTDKQKGLDRVKAIRKVLEHRALVSRHLYFWHLNLTERTKIIFPGTEKWKYDLLQMLLEVFPSGMMILYGEDLINQKDFVFGEMITTPKIAMDFLRSFAKVFKGLLDFSIFKSCLVMNPWHPWINLFDPKKNQWRWSPDYFRVSPLK